MVYPFLNTIYLSLTNWNGVAESKDFVGLANYARMVGDLGCPEGILQQRHLGDNRGRSRPWRSGSSRRSCGGLGGGGSDLQDPLLLSMVLPLVVVGLVWQWIYHPLYGIVNKALEGVGLGEFARGWLADPQTALYAVLIAAIWGASGFCFLILHASLQSVDMSTVEASMIDGANWFQRAWNVIIPQIAPQLTMVTTVTLIGGFAVFDIIYVMTGGGPGHASEVLATYTYKTAFQQNEAGYGSALAMLITALSFVSAVLFVRLRERQR